MNLHPNFVPLGKQPHRKASNQILDRLASHFEKKVTEHFASYLDDGGHVEHEHIKDLRPELKLLYIQKVVKDDITTSMILKA